MPHRNHKPYLIVAGIAGFGLACCVGGAVAVTKWFWPSKPFVAVVASGNLFEYPSESVLIEDIRNCKWWARKPSTSEVRALAQKAVDAQSGSDLYINRNGQSAMGGRIGMDRFRPENIQGTCVIVGIDGFKRWTLPQALQAIKNSIELAEFRDGPANQP